MKKRLHLIILLSMLTALGAVAQTIGEIFHVYRSDGLHNTFFRSEIESMDFSSDGIMSVRTSAVLVEVIPLAVIDSVGFVQYVYTACPDSHHPHLIDLGLPSGTKWACCNVGATAPEGYGGYYAWGETSEKSVYNRDTYQYYNSNTGNLIDIGSDIAGTQYDVAHVSWGGSWRMPTIAQIKELLDNTTSTWTTVNGVYGRKFTGAGGACVFLPAAGFRLGENLYCAGSGGYYWSSSLCESKGAYYQYFDSDAGRSIGSGSRYDGHTVRLVCP